MVFTFDAAGVLYTQFSTSEEGCGDFEEGFTVACLYRVDPATAAATLIGNAGADKDPDSHVLADRELRGNDAHR